MKTIICDIDGTLLDYQHDTIPESGKTKAHIALPGVIARMRAWEVSGSRIIIITGRRESERERTVAELKQHHIPYDVLLMGYADTGRVLINDINWKGRVKAHAINLNRDEGFENIEWSEAEL